MSCDGLPGGRYLGVQLLERVLTREEIQIDVKDVGIRLMYERRYSLHNVTGGAFVTIVTATVGGGIPLVWAVVATCRQRDGTAPAVSGAGFSRNNMVCTRLLGGTSLCRFPQNGRVIIKTHPSVDNLLKGVKSSLIIGGQIREHL